MYNKFTLAAKYLRYYVTASNGRGHGIHSPFIYRFVREVLRGKKNYYAFAEIEAVRDRMLADDMVIEVEDRGAGSFVSPRRQRKISEIAKASLKSPRYAQLLFRLVNFCQPQTILELGTSLGITTAYLGSAKPDARVITIEGAPAIAERARANFSRLNLQNIDLVTGDFSDTLVPALKRAGKIDLAFIDGNHRLDPTVGYFRDILPFCNHGSVLVFDDIHWSREMEQAWDQIKRDPAVRCSVDLFMVGLIFFRQEFRVPVHFTIRF